MSIPFDDAQRDALSPAIVSHHNVSAPAAGSAWATLTPPADVPAGDLRSYVLVVEGASDAYEVTWKPSPAVGDRGITVPAGVPMTFPRAASPATSGALNGWPSFRAIGGSGITVRVAMFRPVP